MTAPSVDDLARSFERHLRAERKSPRTVETYLEGVRLLSAFLRQGAGRSLTTARREDIEAFLVSLHERCTPATVANRYRSLRRFYGWLEEEEEIPLSPMIKMKPPTVPEQPVPVLPDDALQRLLKACAGKDFEARRDTAIVMILIDAGPRLAEIAGARLQDVDFDYGVLRVIGKGGRERSLPFGDNTARALDRYLRKRAQHPHARLDWLSPGQHRWPPSPPVPAHLRPHLASRGRQRNRPHAHHRLALPRHAAPLWRLRCGCPGPGGPPTPVPG